MSCFGCGTQDLHYFMWDLLIWWCQLSHCGTWPVWLWYVLNLPFGRWDLSSLTKDSLPLNHLGNSYSVEFCFFFLKHFHVHAALVKINHH